MDVSLLVTDQAGIPQAELAASARAIPTWRHNAMGSATLTTTKGDPALEALLAPRRELQIWLDGACRFMGVPDTGRVDAGASSVTVEIFEVLGYLGERRNKVRRVLEDVDEATIAANLVTWAQAADDVGLDVDAVATGTLRDREYPADERSTFLELLIALSQVRGGPDFWVEPAPDGRSRAIKIRNSRGARHGDWLLESRPDLLEGAGTIATYSWSWQRPTANDVEAIAGEGATRKIQRHQDAALVAAWGPIQDAVSVDEGVVRDATLLARAEAEVDARGLPIVLVDVTAKNLPELLTSGHPAMVVPILIADGIVQIDADYRANALTIDPYVDRATLEIEAA